MKQTLILYIATLLVMVPLDMLWLGFIARDFYQSRIGGMLEFHMVPALLFYLIYAAGIVIFVNSNAQAAWKTVALLGALFGFVAYSTYDLSNLATLRGWSSSLVMVDIAWGAVATAVAATGGWCIAGFFNR